MEKMNEENIKMIKKLSKLVESQTEEKRREQEKMERTGTRKVKEKCVVITTRPAKSKRK